MTTISLNLNGCSLEICLYLIAFTYGIVQNGSILDCAYTDAAEGESGVYPEVQMIVALKILCYGCSSNP
jgi:hypothetical protein